MEDRLLEILDNTHSMDKFYDQVCNLVPDNTALAYNDECITYCQLQAKVDALATSFLKNGITREDRIAVIIPTRPEFLYVWLAASKIGAAIVGLNFRYTQEEVTYMVNNSKPSVLVCINNFADTDYSAFLSPISSELPSLKKFIFLGNTDFPDSLDLEDLLAAEPDRELLAKMSDPDNSDRDNFIIYTSGTTGKPKGAVIKQKNILAMLRPWVRNLELNSDDRFLCLLPLNHVGGGTIMAMASLARGAQLVMADTFTPDMAVDLLKKYKITLFGGVPTIFEILFVARPDISADMFPDIELVIYGGSPATEDTIKALNKRFGAPVMACYGATEVSGFCSYTRRDDPLEMATTAGKPRQGVEMKIVHPKQKNDLSQGKIGEIAIRSKMVFDRYLDMPRETAKAFSSDGWFYTGDLAKMDKEGYFTIVGRSKEMFINGGFNVYPKEIEDKLSEHPSVSTAAVIGVPHETKGEVGWAFVLLAPGIQSTEEALIAFCKDKMADYKVPFRIFIEDSLPMSPVGKVIKPQLREIAEQKQ